MSRNELLIKEIADQRSDKLSGISRACSKISGQLQEELLDLVLTKKESDKIYVSSYRVKKRLEKMRLQELPTRAFWGSCARHSTQ